MIRRLKKAVTRCTFLSVGAERTSRPDESESPSFGRRPRLAPGLCSVVELSGEELRAEVDRSQAEAT
jgi:hypothetical protein